MNEPEEPRRKSVLPERYRYKPMSAAYSGAMESVLAIVIGAGGGWWVDQTWETRPVGLLVGATIGFGAFVLRLYRLGAAMNDESALSPEADSGPEETSSGRSERSDDEGSERPSGPA